MSNELNYKCPSCGASMEFDTKTQSVKCPFCDTVMSMEAMDKQDEGLKQSSFDVDWNTSGIKEFTPQEAQALQTFVCNSCGGEIMGDGTTAASSCPYCDSAMVVKSNFEGALAPEFIIPFKLDKAAAKEALSKHLTGKKLLPKIFKDKNHIDEIKGIYVPVWLFDSEADADITYEGTKTRVWEDEDYTYTETSYFEINRSGSAAFENVPVDGSSKMADDLMESIEPFYIEDAVDFKTAYLAGYFADRYDIDLEASIDRANQRMQQSTEDAFASSVIGYETVSPKFSRVRLSNANAKYALYPVWLLNTTWNGNKYTFAMNGQTGKFVGDLPVDGAAAKRWFFGLAGGITVAAYILLFFLWNMF